MFTCSIHIYTYIHISLFIYLCICLCVYVYTHIHLQYVYVYTDIHIHTDTHKQRMCVHIYICRHRSSYACVHMWVYVYRDLSADHPPLQLDNPLLFSTPRIHLSSLKVKQGLRIDVHGARCHGVGTCLQMCTEISTDAEKPDVPGRAPCVHELA